MKMYQVTDEKISSIFQNNSLLDALADVCTLVFTKFASMLGSLYQSTIGQLLGLVKGDKTASETASTGSKTKKTKTSFSELNNAVLNA